MSIVAISQTRGGLGDEVGSELARILSYEFADREIVLKAAERFGEGTRGLYHVTEEKPSPWEHLAETQRRYLAYVEAVVWELAARDNLVLVGRGGPFILRQVRHALRVRITAPESLRATRVQQQEGLTIEAAVDRVRRSDRERAARIRFLYHVDWHDPLFYDLVLNTEHLTVKEAARLIQAALEHERFHPTPESLTQVKDLSLTAQGKAALLANPLTRSQPILVTCAAGTISLGGSVYAAQVWEAAEDAVARIPGVTGVRNEITLIGYEEPDEEELSHSGFRHGGARSWGGYGDEWYDREWQARQRYRASLSQRRQGEQNKSSVE